jgi:hypothetical protein
MKARIMSAVMSQHRQPILSGAWWGLAMVVAMAGCSTPRTPAPTQDLMRVTATGQRELVTMRGNQVLAVRRFVSIEDAQTFTYDWLDSDGQATARDEVRGGRLVARYRPDGTLWYQPNGEPQRTYKDDRGPRGMGEVEQTLSGIGAILSENLAPGGKLSQHGYYLNEPGGRTP